MTVIVTDGAFMACDGQTEHHDVISNLSRRKIRRLRDGSLVASSGDTLCGELVADWLDKSPRKRGYWPEMEAVTALHLRNDGGVALYSASCKGYALMVPTPYAIGSGMDFAFGALDMGATVEQAVAVAIKRDPHCGGDIQVEALHP